MDYMSVTQESFIITLILFYINWNKCVICKLTAYFPKVYGIIKQGTRYSHFSFQSLILFLNIVRMSWVNQKRNLVQ